MKFNNLVSLSVTAAALLHYGTFVSASPFFHFDDVTSQDNCQDVRITFPASQDLVFEENSKHVVAWQIPTDYPASQVNLTIANDSNQVSYLGTYDATRGASDEVPFSLGNAESGEYSVYLSTIGGNSNCQVKSVPFTIEKRVEATTPVQQEDQPQGSAAVQQEPTSEDQTSGHIDDQQLEQILEEITGDKHTNEVDDKLEGAIDNIANSKTTDEGNAQPNADQIEGILQEIAKQSSQANNGNDKQIGQTNQSHSNDEQIEKILEDIANNEKESHDNDAEIDKIFQNIAKSSETVNHTNDAEIDKIVQDIAKEGKASSHNDDAKINEIVQDITKNGKTSSHMDDTKIDEIVQGIAKQSGSAQKSDSKDWDEMIDQLDEYLDNDKKPQATHKNAAAEEDHSEIKTFDDYIRSLDQDYTKYIHNNKATEKEKVTHKNSVSDDPIGAPQHVDSPYFTNEDRRTHSNAAKINGASHIDSPYFTNEDRRTRGNSNSASHVDAASPYFTNEDRRTHGNAVGNDHSDAVEDWSAEEIPATENEWHDDSGAADVFDHSNQGEWSAEEYDDAPAYDKIEYDPHVNEIMEGQWTEIGDNGVAVHPDATEWQAEEIEIDNDHVAEHTNDFVEGQWMEIGSEDATHADAAEWQAEEIEVEDNYEPLHTNIVENQWTDEIQTPAHANEWQSDEPQGHANAVVENQWTEIGGEDEEPAHADSAEQWQAEEIQVDNDTTWHSEGEAQAHSNDGSAWQSLDADKHDDVAEWQSEVVDEHGNVAESSWTETGVNEQSHQDATEWQAEVVEDSAEHSDSIVENQWTEIGSDSEEEQAVHDDAAAWQTEEIEPETEASHVDASWHEDSPIFGGGPQSSHVDGGVPILSAEQFIS